MARKRTILGDLSITFTFKLVESRRDTDRPAALRAFNGEEERERERERSLTPTPTSASTSGTGRSCEPVALQLQLGDRGHPASLASLFLFHRAA